MVQPDTADRERVQEVERQNRQRQANEVAEKAKAKRQKRQQDQVAAAEIRELARNFSTWASTLEIPAPARARGHHGWDVGDNTGGRDTTSDGYLVVYTRRLMVSRSGVLYEILYRRSRRIRNSDLVKLYSVQNVRTMISYYEEKYGVIFPY